MEHPCPVCGAKETPKRKLTCNDCWFFIDVKLRTTVYRTWAKVRGENGPKNPLWLEWAKAAIAAVESLNPNSPELLEFKRFAGLLEENINDEKTPPQQVIGQ